jgi:hypothetical protein
MNLMLHLPPETEARLREQAARAGKPVEVVALEALQEKLDAELESPILPADEWVIQFDAWVESHRSRNPSFDDSRGSIYPDRI